MAAIVWVLPVPAPASTTKSSSSILARFTACTEQAYGSINAAFSIGMPFGTLWVREVAGRRMYFAIAPFTLFWKP